MMAFASRVDFKYHCLSVDKRFIDSAAHIVERLRKSLIEFIDSHHADFVSVNHIKVYYDCGQLCDCEIMALCHYAIAAFNATNLLT